jgi:hypothetical protein
MSDIVSIGSTTTGLLRIVNQEGFDTVKIQNKTEVTPIKIDGSITQPGPPGPPGESGVAGGVGNLIDEVLLGVVNNSNRVFTTSNSFLLGSTRISVNGLKQRNGIDFTETGDKEITMDEAPNTSGFADHLSVTYIGA